MGYEDELRKQLAEISNHQKETNQRLTTLVDSLVGDPLSSRKGWVTIIGENAEAIAEQEERINNHDKRLQKLEEKKSKVGSTLLATLGAGGSGSIITANWASIKKFILSVLNGL